MSGLETNKIAASVLVAGIIAMVTGIVADVLYHGGGEHGEGKEAKRGYQVEGAAEEGAGGEAPADTGPVDIGTYLVKADAAAGEAVSKKCQTCHDISKGGPNKVGPNLWGVIGHKRGAHEGFAYSEGMLAKGGSWDYQSLSDFLAAPSKYIPGTKMSFAGIKKPEDRANLLAYLKTLSDSPVPFPAPKGPPPEAKDAAAKDAKDSGKEAPKKAADAKDAKGVTQSTEEPKKGDAKADDEKKDAEPKKK